MNDHSSYVLILFWMALQDFVLVYIEFLVVFLLPRYCFLLLFFCLILSHLDFPSHAYALKLHLTYYLSTKIFGSALVSQDVRI